ncbi:Tetraacyldisaccharide 4'-kinase [compost metagenome]
MKLLLRPLSLIYSQVVEMKNSLYDKGVIAAYKAPVPVVSIGNLTVGGTGKTPITDYLLKNLVKDGKRVAVVSRSYRADVGAPSLVEVELPNAARYYGDEPVLLAQHNPDVDIYVGPSKWQTAAYAASEGSFDVMIVDDGFQHRKLHRDFNIVILDATEKLENYEVVPEGRGRESWASLQRADVIVISKTNLASEEELKLLEQRLPEGKDVLYFGYQIKEIRDSRTEVQLKREQLQGKTLFLVSAIARPDVFEKMMREMAGISKSSLHFRDHHQYTDQDVKKILTAFKESGADFLVTTAKDAVKLRPLMPKEETLWVTDLEVMEIGKKGLLFEKVMALLR